MVVVGGGNTAIDCARTALRRTRRSFLVYRRSRAEMPANREIHEAEEEGIKILFLHRAGQFPVREDHKYTASRCGWADRTPAAAAARNRSRLEIVIAADSVIAAMARKYAGDGFGDADGLKLTKWGTPKPTQNPALDQPA